MAIPSIESMETPYNNDNDLPHLRTAPVTEMVAKEPSVGLRLKPAPELFDDDLSEFLGKSVAQIVTDFEAMRDVDSREDRRHARAASLGKMFKELGMFGGPPATTSELAEALRTTEDNVDESNRISKLLREFEEHPVVAAIDASIDRLSGREKVEAIGLLRGVVLLVENSYEQ
ncbi:MAG: hypothetical protein JWN82_193 [Candidatus Saccharibacteria bacterium]|nr:hypothetical protein [Candidatus Saccharibacteria bacterium]